MGAQREGTAGEQTGVALSELMSSISTNVQETFERERRVLSFDEYLSVFAEHPERASRDAAMYLRDAVFFYGTEQVQAPTGDFQRYKIFDQPWVEEGGDFGFSLVGQERVQNTLVRSLLNFCREGYANRVLLLHGPNGSAKSTIAACLMGGLADYSKREEGALYRFHWVFPKKSSIKGSIGFSGGKGVGTGGSSYAHLPDDQLETRIFIEVRDHPLFLVPLHDRARILKSALGEDAQIPRWISHGTLCHKNQQIFSALLTSYRGDLREVLRHVQVERYFLSKRYRTGAVTLGPELSVDAVERQVTADQNLGALPASLQGLSLYDVGGELVEASGGLLELSDLLKRPIDAFKYLQTTAETAEVSLGSQTLQVNCVFLASGNELHLAAFREHPEYESFRGRFQPIAVPYLRDHRQEAAIYDAQVAARASEYVAPHATAVAARFAVLTRLLKPIAENYSEQSRELAAQMTAWSKHMAYAGEINEIERDGRKVPIRQLVVEMADEWSDAPAYEGIFGVSPRAMRTVLLDAAQHSDFDYLSPFAVLDEIDALCERTEDYAFLRQEAQQGGFHDHERFRKEVKGWLLDTMEDEFRQASGLVDEASYEDLLGRYVGHVSAWLKGEKVTSAITGKEENPDEGLMSHVEELLGITDKKSARETLLGRIAAWAIDHPGEKVRNSSTMREMFSSLRRAVFAERREALGDFCRKIAGQVTRLDEKDRASIAQGLSNLETQFGYTEQAAKDGAARLLAERFRG